LRVDDSYARSLLLIVGINLLNFLDHPGYDLIAILCLATIPFIFIFAIIRYVQYKKYLALLSAKHQHLKS